MYGITYNNKHSFKDFEVKILSSRMISTPTKNKIIETVPFVSGSYDFSSIYGGATFTDRKLEYTFLVKANNSSQLEYKRMALENWLMGSNKKTILIDDNISDYYYNAECIELSFEDSGNFGELKAIFEAYPFKISMAYEGNNYWDSFNFETDYLQDRSFVVNGLSSVNLYNASATDIVPSIIASSQFEITLNGKEYIVGVGESKDYRFKLSSGNNKMHLKGNGTIEFRFRKEVL